MSVDIDYVRRVGEEVREALFPRARADGRQPYPLPVLLRYRIEEEDYQPNKEYEVDVKFVLVRTYQPIGGEPLDRKTSTVDVTFEGYYIGEVDLGFGKELDDEYWVGESTDGPGTWPKRDEALNALFRAIKGIL